MLPLAVIGLSVYFSLLTPVTDTITRTAAMRWKTEHAESASPEELARLLFSTPSGKCTARLGRTSNVSASRTGVAIAKLSSPHKPNAEN